MKICIDGFSINHLKGTGSYSYAFELLNSLFQLYPQPSYHLVWNHEPAVLPWGQYRNLSYANIKINRSDNDYKLLEQYLTDIGADCYFSLNNGFSFPENKVCKYIMTVQDLAPLSTSAMVDEKYSKQFLTRFPEALRKADAIFTASEFLKNDLLQYYHIPESKLEVIYPCCLDIFRPLDITASRLYLNDKYNLANPFILYAGCIHPRKNLEQLLYAYHLLSKERSDYKLVIAGDCGGKRRGYYARLSELVQELGLQEQVVFTGAVELEDMPYLYSCSGCTVNLSSYDGFSLTALEAYACGSPLIILKNSLTEEVSIPTAVYIDTPGAKNLKNSLLEILSRPGIRECRHKPGKMIYDGREQARKLIRALEAIMY